MKLQRNVTKYFKLMRNFTICKKLLFQIKHIAFLIGFVWRFQGLDLKFNENFWHILKTNRYSCYWPYFYTLKEEVEYKVRKEFYKFFLNCMVEAYEFQGCTELNLESWDTEILKRTVPVPERKWRRHFKVDGRGIRGRIEK